MSSSLTGVVVGLLVISAFSVISDCLGDPESSDCALCILTGQANPETAFNRGNADFFTENKGQWADEVRFVGRTSFGFVAFADNGVWYIQDIARPGDGRSDSSLIRQVFKLFFVEPSKVEPEGLGQLPHDSNYLLGSDPSEWVVGASNYQQVSYRDIWDGIDLVYGYGECGLKYEFRVDPEHDVTRIQIEVKGGALTSDGTTMELVGSSGTICDKGLIAYLQPSRTPIACEFDVAGCRYSFMVPQETYNEVLVIDPLIYSTFVGGSGLDSFYRTGIEVDSTGATYIGSSTGSTNFPTEPGSYDTSFNGGQYDLFVMKLSPDGMTPIYSTYIGGSSNEHSYAIDVDSKGNVVMTGCTSSSDYPTTANALDPSYGGTFDCFVTKLDSSGSSLIYSTYKGGDQWDMGFAVYVDSNDNMHFGGETDSTDFGYTSWCFDSSYNGGTDAVVFGFNSSGAIILYSTYVGGLAYDSARGIAADSWGNIYVTGFTHSTDFPTTEGAYDTTPGGKEVFALKLTPTAGSLVYSTLLGTSGDEYGSMINVDSSQNVVITGSTTSPDFPTTTSAYDTSFNGGFDCFVSKLDAWGSELLFSTILGGSADDFPWELNIDVLGNCYVVGMTTSSGFPITPDAHDSTHNGASDAFVVKMDWTGSSLLYSTFLGGAGAEEGTGIRFSNGVMYVAGFTESSDFPTLSAYDSTYNGARDVFVAKISLITVPEAPTNLLASAGVDEISLSWEAPVDDGGSEITGYKIYRGTTSGGESLLTSVGDQLSYTDSSVSRSTTYYYRVGALNSAGEGVMSNEADATTPDVPDGPQNLQATPGDSQASLSWEAPISNGGMSITSYRIFRGTNSGGEVFITSVGGTTHTYVNQGLTNGQTYFFQVSAVNDVGEGTRSNEIDVTPGTNPTAPRTLQVSSGVDQLVLTWLAPLSDGGAAITGYSIYRSTTSGGESLYTSVESVLTYTDTGVTRGVTYYYEVSALNIFGEGSLSNEASGYVPAPPSAPLNLNATAGNTQVSLTWEAPSSDGGSAITGYIVYRGTSPGGETLLVQIGNIVTEYQDTGLTNDITYYYQVSAINAVGEGSKSSEESVTPSKTVPDAPTEVQAQEGDERVDLTWSAPGNDGGDAITAYRIYRGTHSGAETFLAEVDYTAEAYYPDEELTNGQTYYYQVSAVNAIGEGIRSAEISAVPATIPGLPANLELEPGDTQMTISWGVPLSDGGSPITGYQLYRGTSSGGEVFLVAVTASETTYVDTGLVNGRTYYYQVSAANGIGMSARCEEEYAKPYTTPGPPALLAVKGGNANVTVSWSAPASDGGATITGYEVCYGDSTPTQVFGGTLPSTARNLTITGLIPGIEYYFRVAAINQAGLGEYSEIMSATPYTVPGPCTVTSVVDIGEGEVQVTWLPPDGYQDLDIMAYRIYIDAGDGWQLIGEVLGQEERQFTFTYDPDPNLLGTTTVKYRVTAVNPAGETESSPVYTIEWNVGVDAIGWVKILVPIIGATVVVLQRRRIKILVGQLNSSMEEWRSRNADRRKQITDSQKDLSRDMKEFSEERKK